MFGFNSFESEVLSFFKKILPLDSSRIGAIPITECEQRHIDKILEEFKGAHVQKDIAEHLERGITAWGIYNYANDILNSGSRFYEDSKSTNMAKYEDACRSHVKAYFIHPLPMYIFYLASILEEMKEELLAKCMYKYFLKKQKEFIPNQVDEILIKRRPGWDTKYAIEIARMKAA